MEFEKIVTKTGEGLPAEMIAVGDGKVAAIKSLKKNID